MVINLYGLNTYGQVVLQDTKDIEERRVRRLNREIHSAKVQVRGFNDVGNSTPKRQNMISIRLSGMPKENLKTSLRLNSIQQIV